MCCMQSTGLERVGHNSAAEQVASGSPRVRCWQGRVLVNPLFRAADGRFLAVSSHGVRGQGALWVSFLHFVYLFTYLFGRTPWHVVS